jgi:hypothetical protein
MTNLSYTVANVTFNIMLCQPTTCQNGGKCVNPYTTAACDCTGTGATGHECEVLGGSSSGVSAGTVIPAILGSLGIILAAVHLTLRIRNAWDKRKTYHVFISYRVATDVKLAQEIHTKLQERFLQTGHRVRYVIGLASCTFYGVSPLF